MHKVDESGSMREKPLVLLVAGARPNYPKVSALWHALSEWDCRIVDTGQHYTPALAQEMREDLGIPEPWMCLNVGSGTHAYQTAMVLEKFGAVLDTERPDVVIVVGDVNSTVAAALATVKAWDAEGRRPLLAHVEAGLRSGDRSMPEEINRVVTDAISDLLFVTETAAIGHLSKEGVAGEIHYVGNVMVDTLRRFGPGSEHPWPSIVRVRETAHYWLSSAPKGRLFVATLHRPATVDRPDELLEVLGGLSRSADKHKAVLVLVCHPRTQARIEQLRSDGFDASGCLHLVPAMRYREFTTLIDGARLVLTDSGGVQEETTALGVPCLTLRPSTERPVTVTMGTNTVVGTRAIDIEQAVDLEMASPRAETATQPPLWDGCAALRITHVLEKKMRWKS